MNTKKKLLHLLLGIGLFSLQACQTVEQISVDYMMPADISFPTELKRVAIVNNMPNVPENKLISRKETKPKSETEIASRTDFYNGEARIATESLAESIAERNYFDLVVICDSALRSKDLHPREATLAQAEDGYRRVLQVHESGSIADVQLVEVQSKLAQARAAAEAARQAAEDCRVKAPFDGVVGDLQIEEGVEVSPLQPLMRVMDISTVKVRFPVPESEIGKLQVGDEAAVEIPALDNHRFRARMMEKGMTASLLSHTYDCKLEPLDSVQGLMPGMVGKVYMDVLYDRGVVIPASTVQMDVQGKYVWVVNPERKVEKRYVEVAGFSGKGVIVSNGFESDDLLIVEGSRKVSTGMQVEVRIAQSAESQSAAKPSEESQSCSKLGKE